MSWYALFKGLLGAFGRSVARIEVEGREHLPPEGPFILISNHQSVLDPIILQSSISRNDIHTLTKSTQFRGALFRWVLPRLNAIPVRRFRIDPQAVRVLLRHLDAGRAVCIYPEGERTWDGAIQPLRRGAVRVILKAGVPVVPCGLSGTFDVWPRWSRSLRRRRVRLRFGERMEFGRHDDREEREARLEETTAALRDALSELSGRPLAPAEDAGHLASRAGTRASARPPTGPPAGDAERDRR